MTRTVCKLIADAFAAYENCERNGNDEWRNHWADVIEDACRDFLPAGSGFDSGTRFNFIASRRNRLVFYTGFHHMNDAGFYVGWTHHGVVVTPTFDDPDIRVTGRNRNDIKEYIAETFGEALRTRVNRDSNPA